VSVYVGGFAVFVIVGASVIVSMVTAAASSGVAASSIRAVSHAVPSGGVMPSNDRLTT
jgi:hypothetical protein